MRVAHCQKLLGGGRCESQIALAQVEFETPPGPLIVDSMMILLRAVDKTAGAVGIVTFIDQQAR